MEKKQFNTRAYNQIELLPFGLVQKSSSSERLLDEVSYYDSIPQDILHLFPRKVDYYLSNSGHNLVLEYYPYKNLGEYMISNDTFDWNQVFTNLKSAIELMSGYVKKSNKVFECATAMYINKTQNEYAALKKSYYDSELFSSTKLVINGKSYDNFEGLWDRVKTVIESSLLNYTHRMIHGDLCFSNILYHPKVGARFIDMRGSFGERGVYGDTMYDYAKLLHSVEGGYELMINDNFTVSKESYGNYCFSLFENKNKEEALKSYIRIFSDQDINLIRLVQGLIFVGMCARHYDSTQRQMIMYLTGIKNLNEAVANL